MRRFECSPPASCAPPLVKKSLTRIVGASVADAVVASAMNICSRDRENARRPTGPKCCTRMLCVLFSLEYARSGAS